MIEEKKLMDHAEHLIKRVDPLMKKFGICNYIIAGSSFIYSKARDIDVFPIEGEPEPGDNPPPIYTTTNAKTYRFNDEIIQICNYRAKSVKELIGRFDFTGIQIGVEVYKDGTRKLEFTPEFVMARLFNDSVYTSKTDYPLSSLMRMHKYYNRGQMSAVTYRRNIILCLTHIIGRGFLDRDDFKNQLDAVDVAICSADDIFIPRKEFEKELDKLFELLRKDHIGPPPIPGPDTNPAR